MFMEKVMEKLLKISNKNKTRHLPTDNTFPSETSTQSKSNSRGNYLRLLSNTTIHKPKAPRGAVFVRHIQFSVTWLLKRAEEKAKQVCWNTGTHSSILFSMCPLEWFCPYWKNIEKQGRRYRSVLVRVETHRIRSCTNNNKSVCLRFVSHRYF